MKVKLTDTQTIILDRTATSSPCRPVCAADADGQHQLIDAMRHPGGPESRRW